MQDLFNWSFEDYEKLNFLNLKDLESANPTILKHRLKFKVAEVLFHDDNIQTFVNCTMYYRFDSFKFVLFDKTILSISFKFAKMNISVYNDFIIINNGYALHFKSEADKAEFINYFNDYNNYLKYLSKFLCEKANKLYVELSRKNEVQTAINNLLDMFPENFFLSGDAFYMFLLKLCISDNKFYLFLDSILTKENNVSQIIDSNYSDTCEIVNNIDELNHVFSLITQFNDVISQEFNIDCSYMYILTYLLLINAVTNHYSNTWEKGVNATFTFESDKDYIMNCYEKNLIISEDENALSCLAYYLKKKKNSEDFLLKNSLEYIKITLEEAKKNNQKKLFAKNIFKDRTQSSQSVDIRMTIDDIDLMTGIEFEEFIAKLFVKMGYTAKTTKSSGDQGVDVIAEKNGTKFGIQCKCYANVVSNSAIQEIVAGKQLYRLDKLIVITNNNFTKSAQELAQANSVILWDREILKDKIASFFN